MNELLGAIDRRISRRKYIDAPLSHNIAEELRTTAAKFNNKAGVYMHLVVGDGAPFEGLKRSYGMFTGVRNYIALIGDEKDVVSIEKLGYYGEWMVLHATDMGLGTCWVAGTFDRSHCHFELKQNESVVCVITIGYVPQKRNLREKFIHGITHRHSKSAGEMYKSEEPVPEWFTSGITAAQKAPSALNRQPVLFTYKDGMAAASVPDIVGQGFALDLGISKLHFEIGAGGGFWKFGNGQGFVKK